jgi:hypothetical protein
VKVFAGATLVHGIKIWKGSNLYVTQLGRIWKGSPVGEKMGMYVETSLSVRGQAQGSLLFQRERAHGPETLRTYISQLFWRPGFAGLESGGSNIVARPSRRRHLDSN